MLSPNDKPYDEFASWEEVVRYRSQADMLLQIAIPSDILNVIRTSWGSQLEKAPQSINARVEAGSTLPISGKLHTSITLSGTFEEVNRARGALFTFKLPTWLEQTPQSQAECPSHTLGLWDRVVRESTTNYIKAEVIFPLDRWRTMRGGLDSTWRRKHNVEIELLQQIGIGGSSGGSETQRQPVVLVGTGQDVAGAIASIHAMKGSLKGRPQPNNEREIAQSSESTRPVLDVDLECTTNTSTADGSLETSGRRRRKRSTPVLTPEEKPFDTFLEWQYVARYRSETDAVVQLAIPTSSLRDIVIAEGPRLERLQERFGARVEIGDAALRDGMDITSVTFTGSHRRTQQARDALLMWRGTSSMNRTPKLESDYPSSALPPWEIVVRQSENTFRKIEFVVPFDDWRLIRNKIDINDLAAKRDVRIELSSLDASSGDAGDGPTKGQLISISGPVQNVWLARQGFVSSKGGGRGNSKEAQTSPPSNSVGKSDVDGPYTMILEMPGPISRMIVGKGGSTLKKIQQQHRVGCQILSSPTSTTSKFRLYGSSKVKVRKVKAFMQKIVYETCELDGIPPVKLVELDQGLSNEEHSAPRSGKILNTGKGRTETASAKEDSTDPQSHLLIEQCKTGLRALTHPVVLVTSQTRNNGSSPNPDVALSSCRGVTVSSFTSITLHPKPTISFNIRTPSRTWDAISESGRLLAHVLSASPEGAALAHVFTLPYQRPAEPFFRASRLGSNVRPGHRSGSLQLYGPSVELEGAVVCIFAARVDPSKTVTVGDHKIVVAEVEQVRFRGRGSPGFNRDAAEHASGLSYAQRGYRGIGEQIEPTAIPEDSQESPTPLACENEDGHASDADESHALALDEDDEDGMGASIVESELPVQENPGGQAPEQTDIDYFEHIQEEDDDANADTDSVGPPASSDTVSGANVADEADLDLNLAPVEDGPSSPLVNSNSPLIEDSAVVLDESAGETRPSETGTSQSEETDDGEKDGSRKRPVLNNSSIS